MLCVGWHSGMLQIQANATDEETLDTSLNPLATDLHCKLNHQTQSCCQDHPHQGTAADVANHLWHCTFVSCISPGIHKSLQCKPCILQNSVMKLHYLWIFHLIKHSLRYTYCAVQRTHQTLPSLST